ncbi:MAG: hypothetical protein R6U27_17480, partial [Desulfobacterales bacterium]
MKFFDYACMMKKILFRSLAAILVAILILAAVVLVRHRKAQLANQPAPSSRSVAVFVKSGKWGSLAVTRHYLGSIEPEAEAVLSAQTTGYIKALYKDVGDRLQKGEAAAEIDMRLSQAKANALAAELVGAREDLAIKETVRDRRRQLILNGAVSREALVERMLAVVRGEWHDRVPFVQYAGITGPDSDALVRDIVGPENIGFLQWAYAHRADAPNCRFEMERIEANGTPGFRRTL